VPLLSHNELLKLIEDGVISASPENINAASIDLTLDDTILLEEPLRFSSVIDLKGKENIGTKEFNLSEQGYIISPGEFILASTKEVFNLPNNISAEYKLKSSMARNGLDHANAGWADAGFNNSKLTLEFKNISKKHSLIIKAGMKCGQMVFFRHEPVPDHASYATKGHYNNQTMVTASKGVR